MDTKQSIIKSITALVCIILICFSSISIVNKICDVIKKNAQVGTAKQISSAVENDNIIQDSVTVDKNDVTNADENGTKADTTETNVTEKNSTNPVNGVQPQPKTNSNMPSTPAEVINYYNTATAKAFNSKVGFYKERITDNEKINAAIAEDILETFVYKFMGIGENHKHKRTAEKGKWEKYDLLTASKLSTADDTGAKCTTSGENYKIVISLKGGSSKASKSNPETPPTAALDKCGICYGIVDKDEYDHKSAGVIYNAVSNKFKGAEVSENYSNAVVTAVINPSNGQLISLKIEWNVYVKIAKILGITAEATGISHVTYSDFRY